jgi:hypothetical protein
MLAWVAVGFLVPPAFFVAFAAFMLLQDTLLGQIAHALALGLCALWPGGLLLLAFEGVPQVLWPTLLASVVANVGLYAFAGVVVRRLLARARRRLPVL